MEQPQSWSVFVPCYNEGKRLFEVVDAIIRVVRAISGEYEVVMVDDGSTDDSPRVISEIVKSNAHVRAVFQERNRGIGAVQRLAYTTARMENVIIISGDGQFNPEELLHHGTIEPGTWLSFYRQQLPSYNLFRKFLSFFNKSMNRLLYGLELKDVNWAMAFKTADLRQLRLRMNSTLLKSEACIKLMLLGYRVVEIPSTCHPRTSGKAKGASPKIIWQAVKELFKLFVEVQRFKRKVCVFL